MITRIDKNNRFGEAVVCNGVVYISGQVDLKRVRSAEEQTQNVLEIIDDLLARSGSDKEHILRCTVYLSNMGYFHEMNLAWEKWVSKENPPARSVIESALPDPSWKVQISTVAVVRD